MVFFLFHCCSHFCWRHARAKRIPLIWMVLLQPARDVAKIKIITVGLVKKSGFGSSFKIKVWEEVKVCIGLFWRRGQKCLKVNCVTDDVLRYLWCVCMSSTAFISWVKDLWLKASVLSRSLCAVLPITQFLCANQLFCCCLCLFHRTESVAEKMLTNWFTFLLYKFLKVKLCHWH